MVNIPYRGVNVNLMLICPRTREKGGMDRYVLSYSHVHTDLRYATWEGGGAYSATARRSVPVFTCRRLEGVRRRKPQHMLSMSLDSSIQHLRLDLATIRRSTRLALRIVKPLADCDRIDPHALRSRSESARLAQCVGTHSYCDWPGSDRAVSPLLLRLRPAIISIPRTILASYGFFATALGLCHFYLDVE
jgi:hypothetical protein